MMPVISRACFGFLVLLGLSPIVTSACQAEPARVTAEKSDDGSKVVVEIDGQPFAEYLTLSGNKPIVWPIVGPTGKAMTRQWPMAERGEAEKKDHIHHRSLWFTHEKVNGTNFWHEPKKKQPKGLIKHRRFVKVEGGEQATIVTENDWLDKAGKKIMGDVRTLRFGTDGDARFIDFDITLKATEGPVKLGDTKEGTMGIRVAGPLKPSAKRGGRMVNSDGLVDGKAWGKRASWVDYSGPLGDETVGIAVMNHPSSFRYPTHWHARTYGLCAANPFGWSDFERDESLDGSYTIPEGESITLRYRFLFHKGDPEAAKVAEAFKRYAGQAD